MGGKGNGLTSRPCAGPSGTEQGKIGFAECGVIGGEIAAGAAATNRPHRIAGTTECCGTGKGDGPGLFDTTDAVQADWVAAFVIGASGRGFPPTGSAAHNAGHLQHRCHPRRGGGRIRIG